MSRRTEILRRAAEVFERQGAKQTSIGDIAKAVGIKREAVYYYFKGRHEILAAIILPQSRSLQMGLRNIVDSNRPFAEKLHSATENHLQAYNPSYLEMSVALREDHFFYKDEKFADLRKVWKDYSDLWERLIEEGQACGECRTGPDPKITAFAILGMCNWMSRWFDPDKGASIEDIIETYFELILNGLAPNDKS